MAKSRSGALLISVAGAALLLGAGPAAGVSCGARPGDGPALAAARDEIAARCPCVAGRSRGDRQSYLACVREAARGIRRRGALRRACEREIRLSALHSICGRGAGAVACCHETAAGERSCRIAHSAAGCRRTRGATWVGSGESCPGACRTACSGPAACDDGDPCTEDVCTAAGSCANPPIAGCGASAPRSNCAGRDPSTWEMDQEELALVDLINRERASRGISPLRPCRSMAWAAQKHSADQRDRNYFSHIGKDGSKPRDRMCRAGFTLACTTRVWLGENIHAGTFSTTAAAPFDGWMRSDGHRWAMLHPNFHVIGVGHACDGGRYRNYWTAEFASEADQTCR